jgi:hypothetical protein
MPAFGWVRWAYSAVDPPVNARRSGGGSKRRTRIATRTAETAEATAVSFGVRIKDADKLSSPAIILSAPLLLDAARSSLAARTGARPSPLLAASRRGSCLNRFFRRAPASHADPPQV